MDLSGWCRGQFVKKKKSLILSTPLLNIVILPLLHRINLPSFTFNPMNFVWVSALWMESLNPSITGLQCHLAINSWNMLEVYEIRVISFLFWCSLCYLHVLDYVSIIRNKNTVIKVWKIKRYHQHIIIRFKFIVSSSNLRVLFSRRCTRPIG